MSLYRCLLSDSGSLYSGRLASIKTQIEHRYSKVLLSFDVAFSGFTLLTQGIALMLDRTALIFIRCYSSKLMVQV